MTTNSAAQNAFLELAEKLCDNDSERARAIGFMLTGSQWLFEQGDQIVNEMCTAEFPASDADIRGASILLNKIKLLVGKES